MNLKRDIIFYTMLHPRFTTLHLVAAMAIMLFAGFVVGRASGVNSMRKVQPSPSSTPIAQACKRPVNERDSYLILVNEYRLEKGLKTLSSVKNLGEFAKARVEENYESRRSTHDSDLGGFWNWQSKNIDRAAWFNPSHVGELVGKIGEHDNACGMMEWFKNSPTHNAGLIDPEVTRMGIATKENYVVIVLGKE